MVKKLRCVRTLSGHTAHITYTHIHGQLLGRRARQGSWEAGRKLAAPKGEVVCIELHVS